MREREASSGAGAGKAEKADGAAGWDGKRSGAASLELLGRWAEAAAVRQRGGPEAGDGELEGRLAADSATQAREPAALARKVSAWPRRLEKDEQQRRQGWAAGPQVGRAGSGL